MNLFLSLRLKGLLRSFWRLLAFGFIVGPLVSRAGEQATRTLDALSVSAAGPTASVERGYGATAGGGWGLDACLTVFASAEERTRYLSLLNSTGVSVLRERGAGASLKDLKDSGHRVVAFVHLAGLNPTQSGNALPEDLWDVFVAARAMSREHAATVDAWEMVGEPDIGYCADLPDRVVAFQKAVYLGIEQGSLGSVYTRNTTRRGVKTPLAHSDKWSAADRLPWKVGGGPLVLMGALALPPGPWLERARRNGLLDYTDAYNFHFYGHAEDLAGAIRAQARVARRVDGGEPVAVFHKTPFLRATADRSTDLPLWITECGLNAVSKTDFLNIERRRMHADFTVSTARQALEAKRVSVFMPFILVNKDDPHALTLSADRPLPAWEAYAKFTREHPWPTRPLARPSVDPNPIVVQWLPDNATTTPHKVSGTYRFKPDQPISGEFRLYNFSETSVRGRLKLNVPRAVRSSFAAGSEIVVEPGARLSIRGEFSRGQAGYFQGWVEGAFVSAGGARSPIYFGLEMWPAAPDFVVEPVRLVPLSGGKTAWPLHPVYHSPSTVGSWQGINGVVVTESRPTGGQFEVTELTGAPVGDPLLPPMASVGVAGLPRDGFLVLKLGQPMKPGHLVRVDLLDDRGQRFTIWENMGQSYFRPAERETWLNIKDFNVFFWGHCEENPQLRPDRIREIQLRFYARTVGEVFDVDLSWRRAKKL